MYQKYQPNIPLAISLILIGIAIASILSAIIYTSDAFPSVWGKVSLSMSIILAFSAILTTLTYRYSKKLRAKYYDQVFAPLGFKGQPYLSTGRQYHGEIHGKKIHVYLQPVARQYFVPLTQDNSIRAPMYLGDMLEIYIDAHLQTRAAISNRNYKTANYLDPLITRPILGVLKKFFMSIKNDEKAHEIAIDGPEFMDYVVYGIDDIWARNALSGDQTRKLVLGLLGYENYVGFKTFAILPEAVKFTLTTNLNNIYTKNIRAWLDKLADYADEAKKLQLPQILSKESEIEYLARLDRRKLLKKYNLLIWGIVAILVFIPGIIVAIVLAWLVMSGI